MIEHNLGRPDGRHLRVLEQGEPSAPVVLYLHGLPGAADEAWLPDEFAGQVRLLAFDRPGFGGSSPCADYDLATMADDVRAIADWLSVSQLTLLGFSAGGLFALACASLLQDRITRVVSVAAPALHWLDDPDREAAPLTAGAWQGARENPASLAQSLMTLTEDAEALKSAMLGSLSPEDVTVLTQSEGRCRFERAMRQATRQGATTSAATLARELQLMVSPWPYDLDGLSASLCFIHGSQDRLLTVRHLEAFRSRCPGSDALEVPGEGHYSLLLGACAPALWVKWILCST